MCSYLMLNFKSWFILAVFTDGEEKEEKKNESLIMLFSGDKSDVSLEVLVDKQTASHLNSGSDKLYDILVLHLDGGKDLFITVTGERLMLI